MEQIQASKKVSVTSYCDVWILFSVTIKFAMTKVDI